MASLFKATKSSDATNAQKFEKLDKFGYQKSDPAENLIWFCGACR
jgi:hypothetical protein